MATADYIISNQSGASFRTDLNNTLAAIVSNNSNSSSPATTYAYQWWADTSAGVLKIRNSANNAWVELLQLDGTLTLEDGSASTPALAFRDDLNTGIFSSANDTLNFSAGGTERLQLGSTTIFNEGGSDVDFRIEGNTDTNLVYVNAGEDRVAIGANTVPTGFKFAVNGDITIGEASGSDNSYIDQKQNGALEIINSGRDDNDGSIRINRHNTIAGGTTKFRDTLIYNGKGTQLLFVDGSANRIGIGSGATSPSFMLDVQHATDNCLRLGNTNDGAHGDVFAAVVLGSGYYHKAYMAAHSWEFYVNGNSLAKRFEMQSGGDFKLNDGNVVVASGHGIDFSAQTGTSASGASTSGSGEILDHYEEGTWTPTQPTIGTNSASGIYTRIGRQVHASLFATLPTNSSGQALVFDGLPFTTANFSGTYRQGGYVMFSTYGTAVRVLVHDNTDRLQVYSLAGSDIALTNFDNINFRIQVHYTTDL